MHELAEDIVFRNVLPYRYPLMRSLDRINVSISWLKDTSLQTSIQLGDNGTHLYVENPNVVNFAIYATMDNEKICFQRHFPLYTACFSKIENITLLGMAGNLLHFAKGLIHLPEETGSKQLLSNDAFEVESADIQDAQQRYALANARTRDEFWENVRKTGLLGFSMKFKYAKIATGEICNEEPLLHQSAPKVVRNQSFVREYRKPIGRVDLKTTATCVGLFPNQLVVFFQITNSSMVCYHTAESFPFEPDMLCAINNTDGTVSLNKMRQIDPAKIDPTKEEFYAEWNLTWAEQELKLEDIARSAFAYFMFSRNLYDFSTESFIPAETAQIREEVSRTAKQGFQKLRKLGIPNFVYETSWKEERATITTWVFVIWVVITVFGLCFLALVKLRRPRLLPDLDYLYRHAVMQQYTKYNSVKAIRKTPTVRMAKQDVFTRLGIIFWHRN